jgi:hypothetical protein
MEVFHRSWTTKGERIRPWVFSMLKSIESFTFALTLVHCLVCANISYTQYRNTLIEVAPQDRENEQKARK